MAVVRPMATNLLHRAKPTTSRKNRSKRAGWNTSYPERLIRQSASTRVHPFALWALLAPLALCLVSRPRRDGYQHGHDQPLRGQRSERLVDTAPQGYWRTTTLVAGLRDTASSPHSCSTGR
jgi:hypothetical protein